MSESFAEMLEESIKQIHTGEIVDGTVIDVKEDQIILNIGYKADGIITRNEYSSDPNVDLRDVVKVGDEMQAKVRKVNDGEGQVILSRKGLVAEQGSKKLEEAFENQTVITATVSQVMNGGLGVVVDEARVFIPASLVSDTFVKDLSVYKDKEVSFVITEYNPKKRRIIGDCKKLIVEAKEKAQKELLEKIHEGDTIEGTVKNVRCHGEEQLTLRRFTKLEIQLSALSKRLMVIRLHLVLSIQTRIHGMMQLQSMLLAQL